MRIALAIVACLFATAIAAPSLAFSWLEEGCSGTANAVAGVDIGDCTSVSCTSSGGVSAKVECPSGTLAMPAGYSGVVTYSAEDCVAADATAVAGFGSGCAEVTAGVYQEMTCTGDNVLYKTGCTSDDCTTGCTTLNTTACASAAGTSFAYVCGSGAALAAPLLLIVACLAVFLF